VLIQQVDNNNNNKLCFYVDTWVIIYDTLSSRKNLVMDVFNDKKFLISFTTWPKSICMKYGYRNICNN